MAKELNNYAFDGSELRLISSCTKISSDVPPGTYEFAFDQNTGLHILRCSDVASVDFKLYGNTEARVEKSWKAFQRRTHNTGILLSGEAGMGKSVFIKLICAKAKAEGYPIFIVKSAIPGLAQVLSSITTHCVVVLDEFEKNFVTGEHEDNDVHAQDSFLSLMDGMDGGKKLFIAAINETTEISKYFLNRPGRFLYHYKFAFLEQKDVVDYLEDQLTDKTKLDDLATALVAHQVNYDILAAIVNEVNAGESIEDTLQDLNLNECDVTTYDVTLKVGSVILSAHDIGMCVANTDGGCWLYGKTADGRDARMRIKWKMAALRKASTSKYESTLVVPANQIDIRQPYAENNGEDFVTVPAEIASNLRFTRHYDVPVHYSFIRNGEYCSEFE